MDAGSIGIIVSVIVMILVLIGALIKIFSGFTKHVDQIKKDFALGIEKVKNELVIQAAGSHEVLDTKCQVLDKKVTCLDGKVNHLDKKVAVVGTNVTNLKDSMHILIGRSDMILKQNGIDPPEEAKDGQKD